ncbi:MAG: 50S ribosomal protein L11 methyltransferase [Clostridia bacterium]|nr:50S ribosomal protein L11 methyltransferase [Clostridia bacterium]
MENKEWTQIKVTAPTEYLDGVSAVMSMVTNSLMIEDYSDAEKELDGVYGDLIDEELLKKDKTKGSVSAFLPADVTVTDHVAYIKERLSSSGIPFELELDGVSEEDWADSWKKYYKPIKTGKRLVIVPVWEKYKPAPHEITVLMDPGMAFGTGTHETTRLCAALLEKYVKPGCSMLDVGCGSGILAICAAKLGAGKCFACDIDPVSVRIAAENAELNNTPAVVCRKSDLLSDVPEEDGGYDVCTANIVADVIIRLAPDIGKYLAPDAVLIVSGIIVERRDEVVKSLNENGFEVFDDVTENGWYCAAVRKALR